jgi:hypothetical protein
LPCYFNDLHGPEGKVVCGLLSGFGFHAASVASGTAGVADIKNSRLEVHSPVRSVSVRFPSVPRKALSVDHAESDLEIIRNAERTIERARE